MAASTCERPTLPDEQAEPDETATPCRSSAISSVSAENPGTAKQLVFGEARGRHLRRSTTSSRKARSRISSVSRRRQTLASSSDAVASSAAAPNPAKPDHILSAGAHAALLPAAADQRPVEAPAVREDDSAGPLRTAELVAGDEGGIGAALGKIERNASGDLNGIADQQPARIRARFQPPLGAAASRRSRCWRPAAPPEQATRRRRPARHAARRDRTIPFGPTGRCVTRSAAKR